MIKHETTGGKHLQPKTAEARAKQDMPERELPDKRAGFGTKHVLLIVLAILLVVALAAFLLFNRYYSMLNVQQADTMEEEIFTPPPEELAMYALNASDAPSLTEAETNGNELAETGPAAAETEKAEPVIVEPKEKESPEAVTPVSQATESDHARAVTQTAESDNSQRKETMRTENVTQEQKQTATHAQELRFMKTDAEGNTVYDDRNVLNILFIGVDNDDPNNMNVRGNADGLMIASINKKTKQIVLTSLLRDINVAVQDQYRTKLTLAYHYGGTKVLLDTIEQNFSLHIDNYILINYINLVEIIDAFNGVDVDVSLEEIALMNEKIIGLDYLLGLPYGTNEIDPEDAGMMTLNGVKTAAYLRIRFTEDGDAARTERLRKVASKLKEKAVAMSPADLDKAVSIILPNIQTDFSKKEILNLIGSAVSLLKYELITQRIPIDGSYEHRHLQGSDLVLDYEANNRYLHDTIYLGHEPTD